MALSDAHTGGNARTYYLHTPEVIASLIIATALVASLLKILYPAGQVDLLTLKQLIRQPLPKLSRRVTDRASNTKTRARRPKTFAQVLVWDSFCHDAISRFEALDDTGQEYLPQMCQSSVATSQIFEPSQHFGPRAWTRSKGLGSSVYLKACPWLQQLNIATTARRFCQLCIRPVVMLLLKKHLSLL
ncbi:hypothetical protein WJX79_009698 [Trebouxia sp. C0005]